MSLFFFAKVDFWYFILDFCHIKVIGARGGPQALRVMCSALDEKEPTPHLIPLAKVQ